MLTFVYICIIINTKTNKMKIDKMYNRHHYETLNRDAYWDRKFGKFTNSQQLYIIKLIESIENKSVRDIAHLEYFKRKTIVYE